MKIISETSLKCFKAWCGGKDTLEDLSYSDLVRLEQFIEKSYPGGISAIELNDFLWFERDRIADILGYRDYKALVNQDKEDWNDHARSVIAENFPDADEPIVEGYIAYKFADNTSDDDIIEEFGQYMKGKTEELVNRLS